MTHIMLDLETLATSEKSLVVSIGAVHFDDDKFISEFYRVLDITSQPTRKVDPNTIKWWMEQSDGARSVFKESAVLAKTAAYDFRDWLCVTPKYHIWSNGANFDIPIIRDLLTDYDIPIPWKYSAERCYRTVKHFFKVTSERQGTHHNALDDAKYQAMNLMSFLQMTR